MTQTALPPPSVHRTSTGVRTTSTTTGPVLSLHGEDPSTGIPATWHVTALAADGAPDAYLVEGAEGDIHSPHLWMQAHRTATVTDEAGVIELVRSVMFGR